MQKIGRIVAGNAKFIKRMYAYYRMRKKNVGQLKKYIISFPYILIFLHDIIHYAHRAIENMNNA